MNASPLLPDALKHALGVVVADLRAEWAKDVARFDAERRATLAELRADILAFKGDLKASVDGALANLKDGKDGRDGRDGVDGAPGKDGAPGEPGEKGERGDAGPQGAQGAQGEAGPIGPAGEEGPAGPQGEKGADGRDGQDVDAESIERFIEDSVKRAIAKIELPKGEKGDPGPAGQDGVNLAGAIINRDGELVLTLSDGSTRELGKIVGLDGRDGAPGEPGRDGRDGKDGSDGRDGFGFEDLDLVSDERGVFLRFSRGEEVKEFRLPITVDQGVYKSGRTYQKGDGVTFGGSFWIAQQETAEKPDSGKGWRLSVKRGRDGKDGKDGERGPQGASGPAGRDLTFAGGASV